MKGEGKIMGNEKKNWPVLSSEVNAWQNTIKFIKVYKRVLKKHLVYYKYSWNKKNELNIFIPHLQTSSLSFIFPTNTIATLTQKRGERIFEFK